MRARDWTSLLALAVTGAACRPAAPDAVPAEPIAPTEEVSDVPRGARSPEDVERDARSRPEVVLPLLRLEEGDVVLDVLTGGGYYSELLAGWVGAGGKVLAHNNAAYRKWVGPNVGERFAGGGLPQVELYDRELDDLGLAPDSVDAILMVNSYHDLYFVDAKNDWPEVDAAAVMHQIVHALAPGGRLVVVDHAAAAGRGKEDAQALHRIERAFAQEDWSSHGLTLVDESDALVGGQDDATISVFDPSVRGKTDRFVLVFEKPAG